MSDNARIKNKIAVVTGAGGGLGRVISMTLAREGASVVCQDINEESAESTAKEVDALGQKSLVWVSDVADSAAIDEMFTEAQSRLGTVNILVNNAGVDKTEGDGSTEKHQLDQMTSMSDAAWQKMMDIHVNGAFFCTRAMLKGLKAEKAGGSIISISSIAGLAGWGPWHYATAKGALLGFTRSLARFLGPFGIRANAVCPGVIDTPMTQSIDSAQIEGLQMITPMGRIGAPSDIANAVLYLASDESAFVTGQAISPNGGLVI